MEESEKSNAASGYNSNTSFSLNNKNADIDTLPEGVHLIKVKLGGRFEPVAFTKLLQALEEGRFTIVERVSVRGVQMELDLRYYWQLKLGKAAVMPENTAASLKTATQ